MIRCEWCRMYVRTDRSPKPEPWSLRHANVNLEYEQINDNIRFLADVRFKLLGLMPSLAGAAVFVLSSVGLSANVVAANYVVSMAAVVLIALLGFVVMLAITLYDQRNSELYNALIHRAKHLELTFDTSRAPGGLRLVRSGGQYRERPPRRRSLLFPASHDTALALVYGSLLGAWFFPLAFALTRLAQLDMNVAVIAGAGVAVFVATAFVVRLRWLDKVELNRYHCAARIDDLRE